MSRLRSIVLVVTVAGVVTTATSAGAFAARRVDPSSGGAEVTVVLTWAGKYDAKGFDEAMQTVKERIDNERRAGLLDVTGVSVSRRGHDVVVRLSGVTDPSFDPDLVAPTPVFFRPVLAHVAPATQTGSVDPAAKSAIASCDPVAVSALEVIPTTEPADDLPDQCVVLPLRGGGRQARLLLGPAALTGGEDVARARSRFSRGYVVLIKLTKEGRAKFNALAKQSYGQPSPQDEVAIALGGIVQSNPAFQTPYFDGEIQITGNFSSNEASDLAEMITYGTFPLTIKTIATSTTPTGT